MSYIAPSHFLKLGWLLLKLTHNLIVDFLMSYLSEILKKRRLEGHGWLRLMIMLAHMPIIYYTYKLQTMETCKQELTKSEFDLCEKLKTIRINSYSQIILISHFINFSLCLYYLKSQTSYIIHLLDLNNNR